MINPVSGKRKSFKLIPRIEKICQSEKLNYEIREIDPSQKMIEEMKKEENTIFYVVGGDGSILQILPGIVGTNNKLAIIPAGSGNDFYKTIRNFEDGEYEIDVGKINDTYFLNVACIGIDAEVANNIDKIRKTKIPASQRYNASILYTLWSYKARKINFQTKIKQIKSEYMIISICNGAFYGDGYQIAPKSSLTDGLFDIYYAERFHKIRLLSLLPKLRKGKHEGKRFIHKFRTNHVVIESEEEITFNVDRRKKKRKAI